MSARVRRRALLCELHAHSTWSDGTLSLRELVDLYGRAGFDVLCVTDHALRSDDPWFVEQRARDGRTLVDAGNFDAYVAAIDLEAERAHTRYGMLLVPGLELTYNYLDPNKAAHAVALGLRAFVPFDTGIFEALDAARETGAALIAAHPHGRKADMIPGNTTRRFWREWNRFAPLVDRVELFNQTNLYSWVASQHVRVVASGDFHRPEHLSSWKTLLPCLRHERAVVDYLRSPAPAHLLPFRAETASRPRKRRLRKQRPVGLAREG
jgi:predicted metal-dependent phosphoesterase TrpH